MRALVVLTKRLSRNVGCVLGLMLLLLVVAVAILAPLISPSDPLAQNVAEQFAPPSRAHWFGTDELGRDIFSRVVYGARLSFVVVLVVLALENLIGLPVGAVAGYYGGLLDEVIMRITDIFLAFPSFLLAMAIGVALGPGLDSAMIAVALSRWPHYARLVRGAVVAVRNSEYVESARAAGAGDIWILARHILPNCWGPLVVRLTMDAGVSVLMTSGLSFVGLGAPPPLPEWGSMIAKGRGFLTSYPCIPTFPGLATSVMVAGWMLLGDGLRDLLDPKLRGIVDL